MKIFQVPQRTVSVRAYLEGGHELDGVLFAPASGPDGAPGRLCDRLDEEQERFIALRQGEQTDLVNKRSIVWLRLTGEDARLESHEGETAREVRVRVWVDGDRVVEGMVAYTMPPEKARILDYLNAAPPFVPIHGEEGLTLVNRDRVLRVQDLAGERD
jgi:hypothetical protein